MLIMIPQIANFLYLWKSYKIISQGFIRMYDITGASQSIHTIQSFYYRDYKDVSLTGERKREYNDSWIYKSSYSNFNQLIKIDDPFIRNRLDKFQLCEYSVNNLAGSLNKYKSSFSSFCKFVTRNRPNITMIETYHIMQNYHTTVEKYLNNSSLMGNLRDFYESQDTAFVDGASYFLTVGLRAIGQEYLALVQKTIDSNVRGSNWIVAISLLTTISILIAYFKFWLPRRLIKWKILKGCLLCLNNSLVNNEYIKSYFRYKADRRYHEDEFANYFRDS